jgi:1,4-alpha-glucan branching enzyme
MLVLAGSALAQAPTPPPTTRPATTQPRGARGPTVVSPEVRPDRHVVFRILAPSAQNVRLNAGDIPGDARQRALVKGENGVWELTLGPIDPGSYRYTINVDGVSVVDPRSRAISESNGNVWSVVHIRRRPVHGRERCAAWSRRRGPLPLQCPGHQPANAHLHTSGL